MKRITALGIYGAIATTLFLGACDRGKMETCKFVEIEGAELEIELGDLDVERGEVEMVCGDDLVDVTWSQFRRQLQINPERYQNNLEAFKQEVTCLKNERSREKVVFCSRPSLDSEFVPLNFSYDD